MKIAVVICMGAALFATAGHAAGSNNTHPYSPLVEDLTNRQEPPRLGPHYTREEAGRLLAERLRDAGFGAGANANMTYHSGPIMQTAVIGAIFWGPKWADASFVADKVSGLDSFYAGHSNSNYAKTVDEYTDTTRAVGPVTSYGGHVFDFSTAADGSSTSVILTEVCKMTPQPDSSGNGYYAVYSDVPRGNAGYCAWHSYGYCGGIKVQFAFFFNLDGDPGCDPADTSTGHSQGLAALANVSGHEISEARSDPASPGAWYDLRGYENADKCAWTFGAPYVTFTNGSKWKIQGNWSNAAYTARTGYPNSSGQKGCLSGL